MASIIREFIVEAAVEDVWDALRDFNAVDRRVAPGFVVACRAEPGARVVTFANGHVARELLVGLDDAARRIAYSVTGGTASHHNASAQVFSLAAGSTRFVWITDVLPDAAAEPIGKAMDQGVLVMQRALAKPKP
jgi:carbon monoxide dehydrogenase subunit G